MKKIRLYKVDDVTILRFVSTDPYEYYTKNKSCATPNQCTGCTLGQCMQHAHQENSDGFSYTKGGYCRLCSTEHLKTLQMNSDWNVYRKKSKLIYISNRHILLNVLSIDKTLKT